MSKLAKLLIITSLILSSLFIDSVMAKGWTAKEALEKFNAILVEHPNDIDILKEKAQVEYYLGKLEDSIKTYTKALSIIQNEQLYNDRGLVKHSIGDIKGALDDFNKAIEINKKYAPAYANRASAKADFNNDIKGAIEDCELAIMFNPKYSDAYYNKANFEDASKLYIEAINDYKKAISLNPQNIDAYNNLGITLYKVGKKEEAIMYVKKAINLYQKVGNYEYMEHSKKLLNHIINE